MTPHCEVSAVFIWKGKKIYIFSLLHVPTVQSVRNGLNCLLFANTLPIITFTANELMCINVNIALLLKSCSSFTLDLYVFPLRCDCYCSHLIWVGWHLSHHSSIETWDSMAMDLPIIAVKLPPFLYVAVLLAFKITACKFIPNRQTLFSHTAAVLAVCLYLHLTVRFYKHRFHLTHTQTHTHKLELS